MNTAVCKPLSQGHRNFVDVELAASSAPVGGGGAYWIKCEALVTVHVVNVHPDDVTGDGLIAESSRHLDDPKQEAIAQVNQQPAVPWNGDNASAGNNLEFPPNPEEQVPYLPDSLGALIAEAALMVAQGPKRGHGDSAWSKKQKKLILVLQIGSLPSGGRLKRKRWLK